MMSYRLVTWLLPLLSASAYAKCYDPSPAFPVPAWSSGAKDLAAGFGSIEQRLQDVVGAKEYATSSFSIEVTSNTETLWSRFHTARELNKTRPGVTDVDEDSLYRIASITKTFTVLGVLYQHAAGNLSLDDPITTYIKELADSNSGKIPWKDITLRILASQLSGIPREFAQSDVINELDPTTVGLPPASKKNLPLCYQSEQFAPCNRTDLLDYITRPAAKPVFAPNQQSTYSNVAFELLGLAIENVTGMGYSEYMERAIFDPLDMSSSSLDQPSDEHAVLPKGDNYWDAEEGVQRPTGGIYSSSSDMSKYVRYILTHYNALATGVNWFMPASWSTGMESTYGMPFEIFRTDRLLKDSRRPVTLVTKAGGVPGYFSRISMLPEYGLGITILVGGNVKLLGKIQEVVGVELVRAAEAAIWPNVARTYTGSYVATDSSLNSSIELASSPSTGLILNSFVSNSTDVLGTVLPVYADPDIADGKQPWHAQLVPTLLYKNESTQQGEIWRMLVTPERKNDGSEGIFDEFCITDIDTASYAGLPVNEVVFWHEEGILEMPAWQVKMKAVGKKYNENKLVVQLGL